MKLTLTPTNFCLRFLFASPLWLYLLYLKYTQFLGWQTLKIKTFYSCRAFFLYANYFYLIKGKSEHAQKPTSSSFKQLVCQILFVVWFVILKFVCEHVPCAYSTVCAWVYVLMYVFYIVWAYVQYELMCLGGQLCIPLPYVPHILVRGIIIFKWVRPPLQRI